MSSIDFDQYAAEYDRILEGQLRFFNRDNQYFAEYKVRLVHDHAAVSPSRILEFGCGIGRNFPYFRRFFPRAKLYGTDISLESLSRAAETGLAEVFPWHENLSIQPFDLVFVAGVFHHVEPAARDQLAYTLANLTTENGELFVFEQNPHNPVTRRLVATCPFDAGVTLVRPAELGHLLTAAGFRQPVRRYTLFFPEQFKKLRFLERYLTWLPLGGQYFIRCQKK